MPECLPTGDCSIKVSTSCECPYCGKVKGKVFKEREALEKMLFPVKDCTSRFSLYGRYLVHFERSKEGSGSPLNNAF